MEVLSVREFRNNLAQNLDRTDKGEQVIIRRRNALYALVCIGDESPSLTPKQQRKVDKLSESIRRSWTQVKLIEAGKVTPRSAISFVDEL